MIWTKKEHRNKAEKLFKKLLEERNRNVLPIGKSLLMQEFLLMEEHIDYGIVRQILYNNRSKKFTLDDFEREYIINHSNKAKIEKQKWDVYIPYDLHTNKRLFNIDENKIYIITERKFKSIIKTAKAFNKENRFNNEFETVKGNILLLKGYGNYPSDVWEKVESLFYLLRGIVEFSASYGRNQYNFDVTNKIMLKHPDFVFFVNEQVEYDTIKFHVPPNVLGRESFKMKDWQKYNFEVLLEKLKSKTQRNESIFDLICNSIRSYAYAMEEEYDHNMYIRFWQIAELIGMSEKFGGKTEEVVKVLQFLISKSAIGKVELNKTLADLKVKRNDFVHKGINRITESDTLNLKSIVETSVVWLIEQKNEIVSIEHLRELYKLTDCPTKHLNTLKETIHFIEKSRREK